MREISSQKPVVRASNFELLRIVAMSMVVIHHFIVHILAPAMPEGGGNSILCQYIRNMRCQSVRYDFRVFPNKIELAFIAKIVALCRFLCGNSPNWI